MSVDVKKEMPTNHIGPIVTTNPWKRTANVYSSCIQYINNTAVKLGGWMLSRPHPTSSRVYKARFGALVSPRRGIVVWGFSYLPSSLFGAFVPRCQEYKKKQMGWCRWKKYWSLPNGFTPPKFNSSPLKSYRNPIGKDRLPTTIFQG